ncbi:MAG TPA: OmpA family protein [Burkholderiales bacterium]|nr:OmpA family protein [Burkholderiales bacterium]
MAVLALAAVVALVVLLAPAKPPNETIVVLPSADGHVGTVVVQRGDTRQVLDRAYAASRSGQAEVAQLSAADVSRSFGSALQSLPPRPATFLLHFVIGTDELTDESKAELDKVLGALRERPVPDVLVVGHTDTMGDRPNNDRLSAQRAERVKGFLVDIGIAADRIRTAGRGQRELLVPTADGIDEPRNRRVEIIVR